VAQPAPLRLERPKSLTELAEDRLRQLIVSGQFALGEQLSEASLAGRLGISKTPVREALLRLKAEGLIDIQPQRGTFVFSLTDEQVAEICRFREIVEVAALAEAMAQRQPELLKRLDASLARMAEAHAAGDLDALPWLDQEFHEIILDCAGNDYLRQAYDLIASKIRTLRARLPERNDRVAHCQENHAVIVTQVRKRNVERAQVLLSRHIRDTLEAYLEAGRNTAALSQPLPVA
jgi:DNA-binding GntR family transcriptional regulator